MQPKKLYHVKAVPKYGDKKPIEKEVIATNEANVVINTVHELGALNVIEITPIPWHAMTESQKKRVVDAEWDEHERKSLVAVPEMAVSRLMRERARSSHQLTQS